MADGCVHVGTIRRVTPSARGCEDCLRSGSAWVHLRLCRACGHVGCCDPTRCLAMPVHSAGRTQPGCDG